MEAVLQSSDHVELFVIQHSYRNRLSQLIGELFPEFSDALSKSLVTRVFQDLTGDRLECIEYFFPAQAAPLQGSRYTVRVELKLLQVRFTVRDSVRTFSEDFAEAVLDQGCDRARDQGVGQSSFMDLLVCKLSRTVRVQFRPHVYGRADVLALSRTRKARGALSRYAHNLWQRVCQVCFDSLEYFCNQGRVSFYSLGSHVRKLTNVALPEQLARFWAQ